MPGKCFPLNSVTCFDMLKTDSLLLRREIAYVKKIIDIALHITFFNASRALSYLIDYCNLQLLCPSKRLQTRRNREIYSFADISFIIYRAFFCFNMNNVLRAYSRFSKLVLESLLYIFIEKTIKT